MLQRLMRMRIPRGGPVRRASAVIAAGLMGLSGTLVAGAAFVPSAGAATVPITGVVTSSIDGSPVAGVQICAMADWWLNYWPPCVYTDAAGAYSLDVSSDYVLVVSASHPDYVYQSVSGVIPSAIPAPVVNFSLVPKPTLEGTVTFVDGAPAADAHVCATNVANGVKTCTDVDPLTGAYRISVTAGLQYTLSFESPSAAFIPEMNSDVHLDAASSTWPAPAAAAVITAPVSGATVVDAVVDQWSSISGTVTDDVDGPLVGEVTVCAFVDGFAPRCVQTTGDYTLDNIQMGTVQLVFYSAGYTYPYREWGSATAGAAGTPIVIDPGGQALVGYDIALTAGYAVPVTVRNTAGELVDGVQVCAVLSTGEERCEETWLGTVDFYLPADTFTLRFFDPQGRYATEYWQDAADLSGATTLNARSWGYLIPGIDAVLGAAETTTTPTTTPATVQLNTTVPAPAEYTTSAVTTAAPTTPTTATPTTGPAPTTAPTTSSAQVLGATQSAATPSSRTGSGATGLLLALATSLLAAGLVSLGLRRSR